MTHFDRLLTAIADVEFIIIIGIAGGLHGAARATYDVDIVYRRDPANLGRLVAGLAPFAPYLRGAPPALPFRWDVDTLTRGLNFTLTTTVGDIDLLGEVIGGGGYDDLLSDSIEIALFGVKCRTVTLEKLIALKRAAGRPRDFDAIAELELLLDEQRRGAEGY